MYCNKCGGNVPDNAEFCSNCGNSVNAVQQPQSFNTYGGYPPTFEPPKKKSFAALIAALVCILVFAGVFALLLALDVISLKPAEAASLQTESPITVTSEAEGELVASVENDELIDYFCVVGLNSEYGGGSSNGIVKMWETPITVQVEGDYTSEDYLTLTQHIENLSSLGILPDISIVEDGGNFLVYFIPLEEMYDTIPGYVEGNWGYFSLSWDGRYEIRQAVMGIATDVTNQEQRNHLILEEFTQALGLMNDSSKYADSIFQLEWTETQSLADIDYALIRMLYGSGLRPGMEQAEAEQVLSAWLGEN